MTQADFLSTVDGCEHQNIPEVREGYIQQPTKYLKNHEGVFKVKQRRNICPLCGHVHVDWDNLMVKRIGMAYIQKENIKAYNSMTTGKKVSAFWIKK